MSADQDSAHQRGLLKAFAAKHATRTSDALSLQALGDSSVLLPIAEELVAQGWLARSSQSPHQYSLTEDGRLELAAPLEVTLYTRPGCHLCDEAKAQIAPLLRKAGAHLREVNIDTDEVLRERYNVDVPVLFLGARKVAKHRVDLRQFQRQLADAARG